MEAAKEVNLFLTKSELQEMLNHFKSLNNQNYSSLISDLTTEIDTFDLSIKKYLYSSMIDSIEYINHFAHEFKITVEDDFIRLDSIGVDSKFNDLFDFQVFGIYYSFDSDIDFLRRRLNDFRKISHILYKNKLFIEF